MIGIIIEIRKSKIRIRNCDHVDKNSQSGTVLAKSVIDGTPLPQIWTENVHFQDFDIRVYNFTSDES